METRNRERKLTRNIAGKLHLCKEKTAELLEVSVSTLNQMMILSKKGTLKPALEWYRDKPKSPVWFSEEFIKNWVELRGKMHV